MNIKNRFKIVILDINKFFNSALTLQIQHYAKRLAQKNHYKFDIRSYTTSNRCISNLKEDTDLAFIGYYEQHKNIPVTNVLQEISENCKNCKIVLLSQIENLETNVLNLREDIIHFIFKDKYALMRSCLVLDGIVSGKVY